MKGNSLTLTYVDAAGKYTASLIMTVNAYSMDGTWNDSSKQFGTMQWLKVDKLQTQGSALVVEPGHDSKVDLQHELGALKQKMSWMVFGGSQFDTNKEYRVRFNKGGGYHLVECVGSQALMFRVSTAAHYYGCIEIGNLHRWHYRMCGDSAKKMSEDNGAVYCVEERG